MLTLIKNAKIVNEGKVYSSDLLIENEYISKIQHSINISADKVIDAKGKLLIPGIIDDQVHFREPGLIHKGNIFTESKAAVSGGITSYMEMPNTQPQVLTQKLLQEKYEIAEKNSLANFTFFMGVSNKNIKEVLKTDPKTVGGIKIFMGSSTGDMLVDNIDVLTEIFAKSKMLIAVHCEDENTIKANLKNAIEIFGENIPVSEHPNIRSVEACFKSSSLAISLAKKYKTRLHVFHISTEKEIGLFNNNIPLEKKQITAEVCVHHLCFNSEEYKEKGTLIKWNPSIKRASDQKALFKAVLEDKIDVIATDHAPHTLKEKENKYLAAPSGGPLVQHSLSAMLEFVKEEKISIVKLIEKMCHNPAICFKIEKRGFIREGYYADIVLVDLENHWKVTKSNILYKCGWSPFEGKTFTSKVTHTLVNGHLVYENGKFDVSKQGRRLKFLR